jgi:type VI secretion system secreted protein Hcp
MAAVDYFLKIDGIDGESADAKHKGEIQVDSWSWAERQEGVHSFGGGGGAGKVVMQDFQFNMLTNKASVKLFLACASGEHIKKAVLTCRKAGTTQQEFLKVTLSDLLISSFATSGSGHASSIPMEQISINFAKIEWEYKDQKADGSLGSTYKAGWDLKQVKAI